MKKKIFSFTAVFFLTIALLNASSITNSFTLSDEDLMLLDYHLNRNSSAAVIQKTDVPGPGVEFEIYFPDINSPNHSITYVSCKHGSDGLLTAIDINDYDAFALKFTLLSVNDSNYPDAAGSLVVGALINTGYSHAYRPETVSLLPQRNTAVSVTKTDADEISIIGFTAHFLSPDGWDPNGSTVRLLIEPALNAELLP